MFFTDIVGYYMGEER